VRSLKVIGFFPENILILLLYRIRLQFVYRKENTVGIGFLFFWDMTPRHWDYPDGGLSYITGNIQQLAWFIGF